MMRFNPWKATAAAALMLASSGVHAQQTCTLKDQSVTLPLEPGGLPANAYKVRVALNSEKPEQQRVLLIDTGSTGIVIPFMQVSSKAWTESREMGQVLYSSNDVYHPGKIVRIPLQMGWSAKSRTWAAEVSAIDVLAAQCTCEVEADPNPKPAPTEAPETCDGYVGTRAIARNRSLSIKSCEPISPGFGMMGVGYNRGAPTAKNPFLRLKAMDQGSMSPGYELSPQGITLGVTEAMRQKYKWIQLQSVNGTQIEGVPNPPEWQAPSACATFPKANKDDSVCGPVLPDTGIDYMMLTRENGNKAFANTALNKNGQVPAGTEMTITVGPAEAPALQYTYKVGGGLPAPKRVEWRGPVGPPAHINTGRYLLAAADYAYDAACGHAGFRARTPAPGR